VGKGKASPSLQASAADEPCRTEADRGGAACPVGEGESPAADVEEGGVGIGTKAQPANFKFVGPGDPTSV